MGRQAQSNIRLIVEGETEINYFEQMKKRENLKIIYKEVKVGGGGYSSVLQALKKDSDYGYIAKVIILDYDRARNADGERKCFKELVDYCNRKNNHGAIPYFIIANNFDFEYYACLHSKQYKNQETSKFIIDHYKYKTIAEFKSDKKVFEKLNKDESSYTNARAMLKNQAKLTVVLNQYEMSQKGLNIKIVNKGILYHPEADTYKNSNMDEFLSMILDDK